MQLETKISSRGQFSVSEMQKLMKNIKFTFYFNINGALGLDLIEGGRGGVGEKINDMVYNSRFDGRH